MNILVVYYNDNYPIRATINDHLLSFQRYSGGNCCYLNLAVQQIPGYINEIKFDLVVYHTTFLSQRWDKSKFRQQMNKADLLKGLPGIKAALPQDEFIHTDILCDFINEFAIGFVFSVAPESEWKKIYAGISDETVKFHTVLTGYLETVTLNRIEKMQRESERTIDIGYRAWHAPPWLGRHGMLKTKIAEVFSTAAAGKDLIIDISTRHQDTLLGDKWYGFLYRCKYMIGVEGGASILDASGEIRVKTEQYVKDNPNASFEEVERNCFAGKDGMLELFALSPRHLECCATKTCQVLVRGEYNGVLTEGRHYLGLENDLSNVDEVIAAIKSDQLRDTLVQNAYEDIVRSGRYTYESFVQEIFRVINLHAQCVIPGQSFSSPREEKLFKKLVQRNTLAHYQVIAAHFVYSGPRRFLRRVLTTVFSERLVSKMVKSLRELRQ